MITRLFTLATFWAFLGGSFHIRLTEKDDIHCSAEYVNKEQVPSAGEGTAAIKLWYSTRFSEWG